MNPHVLPTVVCMLCLIDHNVCHQEHDGLIDRWKRKNMENLLELHNKTPVWNEGQSSFLSTGMIRA